MLISPVYLILLSLLNEDIWKNFLIVLIGKAGEIIFGRISRKRIGLLMAVFILADSPKI
jgi:hypothetical protein